MVMRSVVTVIPSRLNAMSLYRNPCPLRMRLRSSGSRRPSESGMPGSASADGRLSRESLAERTFAVEGPDLSEELRGIWDLAVRESQLAAALMRRLAPLWVDRDAEDAPAHEGDVEDVQAAVALRTTTTVSYGRIRDAHEALTLFPRLFARVEAGELPIEWLRRVIHRSRDLPEEDRRDLDRVMGDWEFGVTPETFRRLLSELITWFTSLLELSPVERAQRRRHIGGPGGGAGWDGVVDGDGSGSGDPRVRAVAGRRGADRAVRSAPCSR
jgi:hypothetical protein